MKNKSFQDRWPSDGHDHHEISRDCIYENKKISDFLDGSNITFVVASKGMGKTLLMRVKKKLMVDAKEGILVIPATDTEFDEPKLHGTYTSTGFSDVLLWKDLWSVSIVFSILTHIFSNASNNIDSSFLEGRIKSIGFDATFTDETLKEIKSADAYLPSYYLSKLLHTFSESELHKFRLRMNAVDELSDYYMKSAVVVLVDAFDQTLTEAFPNNLEAWKNGQLGLAKATHTLYTKNHHLKVLATIRQEAWAGFVDADREVIKGKALILDYSEPELRKLFIKAIVRYTKHTTLGDFLGVKSIQNECCNESEEPFYYIFRHSTGTARSLMQFGKELDECGLADMSESNRISEIREKVDSIASEKIFADYLAGQKLMFMRTLINESRLQKLLPLIPSNVLTASSLKSINKAFCARVKIPERSAHPFCELFNSGLLGKVRFDPVSGGQYQYFRKPFEFDWNHTEILRKNAIYLIHPGLMSYIAREVDLKLNRVNIVGCDRPWKKINGHDGIPKVFISHASIDKPILEPFIKLLRSKLDLIYPADIWFDKWKIVAGEYIHQEVEKGVAGADIVVLFASASSLSSGWVEKEWRTKHAEEISSKNIRVIVGILDETQPEDLPTFLKGKLSVRCNKKNAIELANAISKHVCIKMGLKV